MRRALVLSAACAALALCSCQKKDAAAGGAGAGAQASSTGIAGPLAPGDMPKARPGLWKVSDTLDGGRHIEAQTCIDEATAANMAAMAGDIRKKEGCQSGASRGLDGSVTINSSCDRGEMGKSTMTGVMRGDFQSHYTMHMESDTTGAKIPTLNRHTVMDMDAQWMGACPAGQKGGDITMNGTTIHAGSMAAKP